jgi:hypothetical protein
MKIKAKGAMQNAMVAVALRAAQAWLNEALQDKTPMDCHESIQNNTDLWTVTPGNMKISGLARLKKHKTLFKKFFDRINVGLILVWLKEDRPDLHSIILNTEGGVEWLERQVNTIKEYLLQKI